MLALLLLIAGAILCTILVLLTMMVTRLEREVAELQRRLDGLEFPKQRTGRPGPVDEPSGGFSVARPAHQTQGE